ncbi:protein rolling stone, putative [Pediculus humanus corporis]|uniref:Protein rolling stone, putative n=1 Tax=Pediculus humanus subsp. corporis TaxID=121224 RepID=E0VMD6_PEDHC|nr:protein rolling stone, putative [Pediculus humanus corporis]EEB14542.1 protein rolling stone, putative [Pediculus humanus corporis]
MQYSSVKVKIRSSGRICLLSLSWIVYRAVMAAYFLTSYLYILPYNKETDESWLKFCCFLTNWTYTVETIYFQFACITVSIAAYNGKKKPDEDPKKTMPCYYKLLWIIYTVVLTGACSVTIIFWSTLYDPEVDSVNATNIMTHVFNSIFILLEVSLVAHPTRLIHFYMPICYASIYAVFSLLYQVFWPEGFENSEYIYKILDWKYPGEALVTCAGATLCLITIHTLFVLVHLFKIWLKNRLNKKKQEDTTNV